MKFNLNDDINKIKIHMLENKEKYKNKELIPKTRLFIKGIGEKSVKINNIYITWEEIEENKELLLKTQTFNQIEYTTIKAILIYIYNIPETIIKTAQIPKARKFNTNEKIDDIKTEILENKQAYRHGYIDGIGTKSIKSKIFQKNNQPLYEYTSWEEIQEQLDNINKNRISFIELENTIVNNIIKTLFNDPTIYTTEEKHILNDKSIDQRIKEIIIETIRTTNRNNEKINSNTIVNIINKKGYEDNNIIKEVIKQLQNYHHIIYYDKNYDKIIEINKDNEIQITELNNISIDRTPTKNILKINNRYNLSYIEGKIILYNNQTNEISKNILEKQILIKKELNNYFDHTGDTYGKIIDDPTGLELAKKNNEVDYYWANNDAKNLIFTKLEDLIASYKILLIIYNEFNKSNNKRRLLGYEITKRYDRPFTFTLEEIEKTDDNYNNYYFTIDFKLPENKKLTKKDIDYNDNFIKLKSGEIRYEFLLENPTPEKFYEKLQKIYQTIKS